MQYENDAYDDNDNITYNTRRDTIIEFIRNNNCYSKEVIVKGLVGTISKMTIYKLLDELKEVGIIKTSKDTDISRDEHIILDENHIFMQVFTELIHVEDIFEGLSKKIQDKLDSLEKEYSNDEFSVDYQTKYTQLSSLPYELYFKISNEYLTRCLLDWPSKINNPEILKILNGLLFTRLNALQNKIQQSVIMLNMSKNVHNYHNREELFSPVIESIKKIDLNDFKKNIDDKYDDKYINLFKKICSLNEYEESNDINSDEDINLDNVDTNRLTEEDKQIVDSWKYEKLYKKNPYENFDIEEYRKIENINDEENNTHEPKK